MDEDIEGRLRRMNPRGAPAELRRRVLDALAVELQPAAAGRPASRPALRAAIAVAACLLAGLALNVWANETLDRRLAIVLGPPPVSRQAEEIAAEVASLTDPATGRWAYERLVASRSRGEEALPNSIQLRQMIQELTAELKENAHETTHQNPQMDRDRRGSRDRRPVDTQCLFRLEHGHIA